MKPLRSRTVEQSALSSPLRILAVADDDTATTPTIAIIDGMSTEPILQSTLTCPHCGHVKTETMPTDACQWFYECEGCHVLLRPKPGDCCVFCSYGTVPCPPIQEHGRGHCC